MKKIIINTFLQNIFLILVICFFIFEMKYRFIEIILIPKKISFQENETNVNKTRRKDLILGYRIWIEDNYDFENNTYILKKKTYNELKILGDKFYVFFDRKTNLCILYTLILIQLLWLILSYIIFKKNIIKFLFISNILIFLLSSVFFLILGTMMITNSWP